MVLTSSGQEWQFHIATDVQWSGMAISHCYWCPVVKNGKFTLLMTSSGQEWQLADLLADVPSKCLMGYILWDVFGSHFGFFKKRWEFPLFSRIIRLVNSQLALYSHVRCNHFNIPQHSQNTPYMTITNFNYEGSYLPGVIHLTCQMSLLWPMDPPVNWE